MSTPRRSADPPAIAPPTGRPGSPPPPNPVFAVTGNARVDSVLTTLDITIAPFRSAPPADQGAAGWVAQGLGGALGLINAPMMFIDAAASQGVSAFLDATGLGFLFPPMPVAVIGLSMHLGTPHTHVHPPSLIPPAPPIPLPSLGVAFLAGSASVLVGGVPALRAGDIGIGLTCGSMAPPFEIMTGASGVYFGGSRVARFGMDITFHCNPVSPMGAFAIGMGIAGIVAGAAGAAAQASAGNSGAAIAQGIQAALDAAAMAVSALRGKDPAGPPGIGVLLGPPMGNVMAGGPPIPNIGALAQGRIYQALGRALRSAAGAMRRRSPPPDANGRTCDAGEPVHVVTGENYNTFVDFVSILGGFRWERFYSSAIAAERGVLGHGWRHSFQSRLVERLHRVTFESFDGTTIDFPRHRGAAEQAMHGYRLRRLTDDHYTLSHRRLGVLELRRQGHSAAVFHVVGITFEGATIEVRHDEHRRPAVLIERRHGRGSESATYQLRYDGEGQLSEVWGSRFGATPLRLAHYEYDAAGNLARASDAIAAADVYRYDGRHRMVRSSDRIGYGFRWSYDIEGRCIETAGKDGLWYAKLAYAPGDRTTVVTIHDGSTYTYRYDEDQVITEVIGPCGDVKQRLRHIDGRIIAEVDSGGARIDFEYDDDGGLVCRRNRFGHAFPASLDLSGVPLTLGRRLPTNARGFLFGDALPDIVGPVIVVEHKTDRMGQVVYEKDSLGREQRWTFDPAGNETTHTDRDGRVHRTEVVRWGLVGAKIDPLGNATRYEYNPHQRITAVIDAGGTESRYVYDSRDRVIEVHRHGRLRERYEWDLGHRMVAKYDGDGKRLLAIKPHRNGLPRTIERADGSRLELDYDARGKVTRADSGDHRVRRKWDAAGRLMLEDCDGRVVEHQHGTRHRFRTRVAGRFVIRRWRDGDRSFMVDPTGATAVWSTTPAGTVDVRWTNGVEEQAYFDREGRLLGRDRTHTTSSAQWSSRYAYSAAGDLREAVDSVRGVARFDIDAAHRVVGVLRPDGAVERIAHDAAGNLVELEGVGTIHLANGNRVHTVATERFLYDDRGRLTTRVGFGDREIRYQYDAEDQLVRVEDYRGQAWTATYDALGRRVIFGRGDRRTRLWWDGDRVAASEAADGRFRVYLYLAHAALVPVGFVDYDSIDASPRAGLSYAVVTDQVGLPLHIEDRSGTVVWWADRTTVWGELLVRPGNQLDYAPRYPGHWYDDDLGLHYNRFRDYDPRLGRYLQPDPLGIRGGVNLYAYAGNPLVSVDVLGLSHTHPDNASPHPESGEGRPAGDDPNEPRVATPEPAADPPARPPEDPANPSPARRAELDAAQALRAEAEAVAAAQPTSRRRKTVAVNGGEHLSGYDTVARGTPEGFETAGRDPRANLGYEAEIGHESPANASVDPRVTADGEVVGARGTGDTLEGGAAATHAERQSVIAQNGDGTNDPIGVSREQCGDCREFFREHAENPDRPGFPDPVVVGDPAHTRVYNADGSVDVYRNGPDGSHELVRTVPAGEAPEASVADYEGIPW